MSLVQNITVHADNVSYFQSDVQESLVRTFESFGAKGDGTTDDTAAMLSAIAWLEEVPFRELKGSAGARYLITQNLVMPFNGDYTQNIESTRTLDFTGTTIVAGANDLRCVVMAHDFCRVINPAVANPNSFTGVVAYSITPEDLTQTTQRVSQQFCTLEGARATDVAVGVLLQPGPTVGGANSGAYYHTIKDPVFENVVCGFRFNRSVSGDNNNTRITIYNPVHVTGNCAFWIESTDSLRVYGGSCENIRSGTSPADVPCGVRVVKTVASDPSVAGNLRFYGYFGELCTRSYQIDANVGSFENFFDWSWTYITEGALRDASNDYESICEFDGALVSSNWAYKDNIIGARNRSTGSPSIMIQKADGTPTQLYSENKWTFTSPVINVPFQDGRNTNSDIQLIGATNAGILLETTSGTKGITLSSYDGSTSSGNPNGDLRIGGYNGILPNADNATVLGYTGARWSAVYAASSTIVTSDETLKQAAPAEAAVDAAEKRAAARIKQSLYRYKFKQSIAEKGEADARLHFGVGAQTVERILTEEGLDASEYAFLCKDTLEDGTVRYSVRYEEIAMFLLMHS
jgi:hypothetical protein